MKEINAIGDVCPLPVVKTKKALQEMRKGDALAIWVDNEIAVQNLEKLAASEGAQFQSSQAEGQTYRVTMTITADKASEVGANCMASACASAGDFVVVLSSDKMGEGDEKLGAILIKGFVFALTQLENVPATILLYNGGAHLTTEGSPCIEDLKNLEAAGAEILTCGTCLKHYGLEDKLLVGGVTNMYTIVEKMIGAGKVIRP